MDFVSCSCGEITIGPDLFAKATDFANFLRIDEDDNEKPVQYQDKQKKQDAEVNEKEEFHIPIREQLTETIEAAIQDYEHLSPHDKYKFVTETDIYHMNIRMLALLRSL